MHPHAPSPRTVARAALWVLRITGPLAAAMLAGWLFRWLPDTRRMLVLYNTLLLLVTGAGCVYFLSMVQLAIHQAFSAGYQTGQASVWPNDRETRPRKDQDPLLRLVE